MWRGIKGRATDNSCSFSFLADEDKEFIIENAGRMEIRLLDVPNNVVRILSNKNERIKRR